MKLQNLWFLFNLIYNFCMLFFIILVSKKWQLVKKNDLFLNLTVLEIVYSWNIHLKEDSFGQRAHDSNVAPEMSWTVANNKKQYPTIALLTRKEYKIWQFQSVSILLYSMYWWFKPSSCITTAEANFSGAFGRFLHCFSQAAHGHTPWQSTESKNLGTKKDALRWKRYNENNRVKLLYTIWGCSKTLKYIVIKCHKILINRAIGSPCFSFFSAPSRLGQNCKKIEQRVSFSTSNSHHFSCSNSHWTSNSKNEQSLFNNLQKCYGDLSGGRRLLKKDPQKITKKIKKACGFSSNFSISRSGGHGDLQMVKRPSPRHDRPAVQRVTEKAGCGCIGMSCNKQRWFRGTLFFCIFFLFRST